MANETLYEVAVLHRDPETKKAEEVISPKTVLASSSDTARLKVVREVPESYDDKIDELEVIVRPFR